jgi:hypothetical protein
VQKNTLVRREGTKIHALCRQHITNNVEQITSKIVLNLEEKVQAYLSDQGRGNADHSHTADEELVGLGEADSDQLGLVATKADLELCGLDIFAGDQDLWTQRI